MSSPSNLAFPDAPKSELDSALQGLISSAQRVADTQGRLRGLLQANRAVVEQADLPVVLRTIVEAAIDLVGARYGALGVMSPGGGLEEFIQVGITDDVVARIGRLPQGHGLLGAVLEDKQPIRMHRLQDDARSVGFPAAHPDMSVFLGVPIRVRDQMFGSLYFAEKIDGDFTVEDEELLGALASTAGIAIENARLLAETRQRQRWSSVAAEIATALVSEDDLTSLRLVADHAADLAEADLVCIIVPGPLGSLLIDTARGLLANDGEGHLEGRVVPADATLAQEVMTTGESILHASLQLRTSETTTVRAGPTICVPLVNRDENLGVLLVARGIDARRFTPADLEMVSDFARHAALAIDVSRARQDRHLLERLEDRNRIARDLHDHVIQRLFAAGLELQSVARASTEQTTIDRLEPQIDSLDTAISEIRTAIFALGPTRGGDLASLRHRIIDLITEVAGLFPETPRLTFTGPVDLAIIDDVGHDLIAVVREGLTNVARHAAAENVSVSISVDDNLVRAEILDDGRGIGNPTRSSGLANLRARAARWNGELLLRDGTSGGTCLTWTATLPIIPDTHSPHTSSPVIS